MKHLELTYRLADYNDVHQYFEWANDQEVRQNSFSNEAISFDEHQKWFQKKLNSDRCFLLLCFLGKAQVGQLRIDLISDNLGEIDYSVDEKWRGMGVGTLMLQSAKQLMDKVLPAVVLKGVVLAGNQASVKSFRRAGFAREEKLIQKSKECLAFYSK